VSILVGDSREQLIERKSRTGSWGNDDLAVNNFQVDKDVLAEMDFVRKSSGYSYGKTVAPPLYLGSHCFFPAYVSTLSTRL
jgi:hypothetical protein